MNVLFALQLGFDLNWKINDFIFYIDVSGRAEASVSLDAGLYFPANNSIVSISLHIGIHGLIGSGEVGVKLSLFLNKDEFIVDLYAKLKAFEFSLYMTFRITISFNILKKIFKLEDITYEFSIFSHTFLSLINSEFHIERIYKYNRQPISSRNFLFLQ